MEIGIKNVLGIKCSQIVTAVVSDHAALSVAKNRDVFPLYEALVDVAPCLMHDMDKPQASAIGKLVRSSKRAEVNPFPAIKVQLDLNDTRVAAQHGLFLSLIRMMPALKVTCWNTLGRMQEISK